jgi:hypothetical protein
MIAPAGAGIWGTLLAIMSGRNGWFCVPSGFFGATEKQLGKRFTGVGGFLFRQESIPAIHEELNKIINGEPIASASILAYHGKHDLINEIAKIIAR